MHIDAHTTAIDLARSQLDQPYRSRWQAALFGNCVERQQRFHGIGKDHSGVIHSVVRADAAGVAPGAPTEIRGARTWAKGAVAFSRFARFVEPALVNGAAGLVFAPGGRLSRALSFKIAAGKIVQAELIADPERLRHLDLAVLND